MSFQLTVVGKTWTGILLALGAGAITAIVSIQHARAPERRTLPVTPAAAVSSPDEDVPLPPRSAATRRCATRSCP